MANNKPVGVAYSDPALTAFYLNAPVTKEGKKSLRTRPYAGRAAECPVVSKTLLLERVLNRTLLLWSRVVQLKKAA